MSGFPARLTRSTFGPTLVNAYPVENPEQDVGAEAFNPAFWQLAGMNRVSPIAFIAASWDGAAWVIAYQEEAWNPNGTQARPVLARTNAGTYTLTFASTYQDEAGAAIATVLRGADVRPNKIFGDPGDRIDAYCWIDPAAPLVINILILTPASALEDAPFSLTVY